MPAPSNLDDEDFDETTTVLPPSKPAKEYTFSSFQNLARQSLPLRLELSRLLTGPLSEIDYDQVPAIRGLDVAITTSAKTDESGRALLGALGLPFAASRREQGQ